MTKIGRNQPCHCGSGKKYKHCCLELDQLNEAAQRAARTHNEAPVPEFHGLSPSDMAALLYGPLKSPQLVELPAVIDSEPTTPVTVLAMGVIDAIGDGTLKATAKGNLPAKLCKRLAEEYRPWAKFGFEMDHVSKEEDFRELHGLRRVLEMIGLMRRERGGYRLTQQCHDLVERGGVRALYPALLQAYATQFNWSYFDLYPELPHVQHGWLFSLYLLHQFGDGTRTNTFFEDQFIDAFPALWQETVETDPDGADDMEDEEIEHKLRNAYSLRTFERFAQFLGLAELTFGEGTRSRIWEPYYVKAQPLLTDAVRWQLAPRHEETIH